MSPGEGEHDILEAHTPGWLDLEEEGRMEEGFQGPTARNCGSHLTADLMLREGM